MLAWHHGRKSLTFAYPRCPGVQVVLSQVILPNLDCWGPGESIDTNIVGAWNKKGKVTFAYPRGPRGPGGPESGQIAKS